MADSILFHFQGHEVRYVGDGTNHAWVAQDVCRVLGIQNASDALKDFKSNQADIATIYVRSEDGTEQARQVLTVTEAGLYRLLFKSRKPVAEKFQDWVTDQVLPSIRKTGSYSLEKAKDKLERQFLPTPDQREIREAYKTWKMAFGKGYADRWLMQIQKRNHPVLVENVPLLPEEQVSLPVKPLLTPTQIGQELGMVFASGKGNPIKTNKLLCELGYQEKIAGQWSPTTKAIEAGLCDRKPVDTNSRTQKDQLLWTADILPILCEFCVGSGQ